MITELSSKHKQEHFDWAKKVIDQLRGSNPVLETLFDTALG
jgi:hypothetical protein